jgi:hypothetical protein
LKEYFVEKKVKRTKIAIGINSLVTTTHPAYSNHIQFFYRLGRSYPDVDVMLVNPPRMSIDRMRNMASELAMREECDYLLFIDDDVLLPVDGLKKLIALDADIAAGDVIIRGYPFDHMLFRYTDKAKKSLKPLKTLPKPLGPIPVDAVGFSFCLIKVSLLKRVGIPHFITGPTNTEDIYFCLKAKIQVPDAVIKADTTVTCGHILWNEVIDSTNKKNYKAYMERQFPELLDKPNEAGDRGTTYAKKVQETVARSEAASIESGLRV